MKAPLPRRLILECRGPYQSTLHGRPFFASRASGPQNVKKGGRGDDASDRSKDQCQTVAFPAFLFDVAAHHDNTFMRHGRHAFTRVHMPGAASAHPVECAVADGRETSLLRLRLRRQVRINDASHCDHAKGLRQSMCRQMPRPR